MDVKASILSLSKLTRAGDWRLSFIPFIIGCVYFWLLWFGIKVDAGSIRLLVCSLLTSFGFAALGYFINEYFDREADKKAGKLNKLELLKPFYRILLFITVSAFTFLPWYVLPHDSISYVLIGIEIGLFLVYSLPFPRVKGMPYVSGVVDASYAYVVPLMLSFHTYALYAGRNTIPAFLPFLLLSIFFIGYRNIVIHHVNDIFNDIKSGIITLPQKIGPARTNTLILVLFLLEIVFFAVAGIFMCLHKPIYAVWLLFYLMFIVHRVLIRKIRFTPYLSIEPARHFTDMAYQIWFPLFMLAFSFSVDWRWMSVVLFHVVLLVPMHFIKKSFIELRLTIRPIISASINYPIYFFMRLFGVDLRKENKSLMEYLRHRTTAQNL